MPNSIIISTGCCIPSEVVPNTHFLNSEFYGADGVRLEKPNPEIIQKLYNITGIRERRHVSDDLTTTDIAYEAALQALEGIDKEGLDYIIVAQNFGDVRSGNLRTDMVPTIASRVKHRLRIENPYTVAYDIPFGCPGWLQGMIMADYYIRSGDAQRVLVIGAEILSRVSDPHDVDRMILPMVRAPPFCKPRTKRAASFPTSPGPTRLTRSGCCAWGNRTTRIDRAMSCSSKWMATIFTGMPENRSPGGQAGPGQGRADAWGCQ
jgi:hypothetical protein